MNNWRNIWEKERLFDITLKPDCIDVEKLYAEMRKVDGYDAVPNHFSWNDLLKQWKEWDRNLNFYTDDFQGISSVFEVGCGSGPNLLLYKHFSPSCRVGGIDYSEYLIGLANKFIDSEELYCEEAIHLNTDIKYDAVISYSVFHYFPSLEYAQNVLEKMYQKSTHVIAILDVHDAKKEQDFLMHRRTLTPDYDVRYSGLEKLFFEKQFFLDFAENHHCNIKFDKSNVKSYWNNDFVYHCYLYK